MKRQLLVVACIAFIATNAMAQKKDTIIIGPQSLNTKVLKEGTHRYLVYFKMSKDAPRSETQFWTRKIERSNQDGKNIITVTQEWEYKDTILHTTKSVCDAQTFQPITHEFWWKQMGAAQLDFSKDLLKYNGQVLSAADTARRKKAIWSAYSSSRDKFFLNWHLDMEVFPALPFKNGVTFVIPFYDPGTQSPFEEVAYTVTGSARLTGYNNQQIDCWLMVHEEKNNKEVYWISKKTREVLKLEQEINGKMFRYKIKLGFSV